MINKIIRSLGSNKLTEIINAVCDKQNTPVSNLVKHGNLMWYNKNLQVDNIAKIYGEDGFSHIPQRIMEFLIVDHCSVHKTTFREKQKIEQRFNISSKKLLNIKRNE